MANTIWQWFQENSPNKGGVTDKIQAYLTDLGYIGATNETMFSWLGSLGYTGTLSERISRFESIFTSGNISTDQYYPNVTLLLPMNGTNGSTTFTDSSLTPETITVNGNTQISTAQFKWGSSSGLFDGTTDWLYSPVGTGNFLGSNFTVEGWFNWTALTNGGLFHVYPGTPAGTLEGLAVGYDGTAFQVYSGATNHSRAYTPVVSTWYHVALVRVSGSLTLYVNGIAQGATISDGVSYGGNGINIGLYYSSSTTFNGYMNDFRVTLGIARYTSNFTPPTSAFSTF